MRFLILTQYFPPEIGGAQTRLKCLATELARRGHEVEIVTSFPNYPKGEFFPGYERGFYRRELWEGLTLHRVWLFPAVGSGIKRMLNYGSFTLTSLFGLLRCKRPDYIFVESPPLFLSMPAWLLGLFWRTPFIFNVADLWPDVIVDQGFMKEGVIMKFLRAIESWSYRRAAYVNSVTDWIVKVLQEKKGVPPEQILFLPNGADTETFRPRSPDQALISQLNLAGKQIVLWAGTLGFAHGIDNILNAAKLLESSHPQVHFLFVGNGSARADLIAQTKSMNLANVTFIDAVPLAEIVRYYSICFCGLASLINIPVYEGARPSKVFPVLASAKPLIFIGSGEGARLVETAEAGAVVPAGDPQALADTLVRFATDPSFASERGANGRRFVEENLQWSAIVGSWLDQLATPRRLKEAPDAIPS
ncbi:MAG: glycosyltransferase family 4 protein [Candidatus Acidiferrum sp.]